MRRFVPLSRPIEGYMDGRHLNNQITIGYGHSMRWSGLEPVNRIFPSAAVCVCG